jgi:hypothetical protein
MPKRNRTQLASAFQLTGRGVSMCAEPISDDGRATYIQREGDTRSGGGLSDLWSVRLTMPMSGWNSMTFISRPTITSAYTQQRKK